MRHLLRWRYDYPTIVLTTDRDLQGIRGMIRNSCLRLLRRCSAWNAVILFALTALPTAPAVAQYAGEWHEWHGQQWSGGPGGLPPPPYPTPGSPYGIGYPTPGYYYSDHTYGYLQPYPYGYSAGFSEGFAAGYDQGFTGGLNNASAGAYGGYAGQYDYYGYPSHHGY